MFLSSFLIWTLGTNLYSIAVRIFFGYSKFESHLKRSNNAQEAEIFLNQNRTDYLNFKHHHSCCSTLSKLPIGSDAKDSSGVRLLDAV